MNLSGPLTMHELLADLPQSGVVEWLGVRPARQEQMLEPDAVELRTDIGLVGDRYAGRTGTRHVTLIQMEHLHAIASYLHVDKVEPSQLRRNICVSGINLLALKDKQFQIGDAVLMYTGLCHPCSAMQKTFGPGGYNAVRGHGGITARVVQAGVVRLADTIRVQTVTDSQE